jgi:hypothetical protein
MGILVTNDESQYCTTHPLPSTMQQQTYFDQISKVIEGLRQEYPFLRCIPRRAESSFKIHNTDGILELKLCLWCSGAVIEATHKIFDGNESMTKIPLNPKEDWQSVLKAFLTRLAESERLQRIRDYWSMPPAIRCRSIDQIENRLAMLRQLLLPYAPSSFVIELDVAEKRLVFPTLGLITSAMLDGDDVLLCGPLVTARYHTANPNAWQQMAREWKSYLHQDTSTSDVTHK